MASSHPNLWVTWKRDLKSPKVKAAASFGGDISSPRLLEDFSKLTAGWCRVPD